MSVSLETPPQNSSQLKREALIFAGVITGFDSQEDGT